MGQAVDDAAPLNDGLPTDPAARALLPPELLGQAPRRPPLDIALSPEQEWELRVVVWGGEDLPVWDVDSTGLADWYVSCSFGGSKKQLTDTHFRAKRGKASWNWRFKFPVTLTSSMKYQRLTVQLWDKDLISANDMIGSATLKLDRWFRRVYLRKQKVPNYWDAEGAKEVRTFVSSV